MKKFYFLLITTLYFSNLIANCGDTGGPTCYGTDGSRNLIVADLCPTNPTDVITIEFTAGFVEDTWDELEVWTGTSPVTNATGTRIYNAYGTAGNLTGLLVAASTAGQCLTVYVNADGSNNCGDQAYTPITWTSSCVTPVLLPGENCSNAINLDTLTSPFSGTTVGYNDDISECRTGSPDRIFYIDVADGFTLDIGETTNGYDEYEYIGFGATCPGATTINCYDNDALANTNWVNTTGSTQRVWWVQDGFSNDQGTFNLEWSLTPPAPVIPGDLCSNPIALLVEDSLPFGTKCTSSSIFDLTTFTNSLGVDPGCTTNGDNDIWFQVIIPPSGEFTLETSSGGDNLITDTWLELYENTCDGTEVTCWDDDDSPDFRHEMEIFTGVPGTIMTFRVGRTGSSTVPADAAGDFGICAYDALPAPVIPGDLCSNPIALLVEDSLPFGTKCTSSSIFDLTTFTNSLGVDPGCTTNGDNDIWFQVIIPPSGEFTLETSSGGDNLITDTWLELYENTCDGTEVTCWDDDDSPDFRHEMENFTGVPGAIMTFRVGRTGSSTVPADAAGDFGICAYDALPMVVGPTTACGCTNCPLEMPDNFIDTFHVYIADTLNGDCDITTNPLTGVSLQFDHQYIGDLTITLVSPGGQSVELVGATGLFGSTDGSTWDVDFTDGAASPDAGQTAVWTNDDGWGTNNTFTGTYNPHVGTLGSLNTGTICGDWQLIVSDDQGIDTGNFQDFQLTFFDPTDLDCNSVGAGCSTMDYGLTATSACSGATINILQDNCVEATEDHQFKFYYYEGASYGTITIPAGAETAADLNAANPGLNSVFIGRQDDICTDALPTFTYNNLTCAAINVNIFVLVEEEGLDTDNDTFLDYRTDCPAVEHVVSVQPAQLTTLVTDDGSSCGTPTIELRSANSSVCSTLTGPACSVNGDSYNWDFSSDLVITVLDNATCSNAPTTLSGSVNCSGCAPTTECGCTNCPLEMPDNFIDTFSVFVADTLNGDCDITTNPLTGVSIQFDHQYIGDLTISLLSPGGQTVELIGATGLFGSTDGSAWDVAFTDGVASPDPGQTAVWTNDDGWGVNGTFTGTYNPHVGNLSDFNTGTICGEWQLIVSDDQGIDTGNFQDFQLTFFDATDLGCNSVGAGCSSMDFGLTATSACSGATINILQDNCVEATEDHQFKFYYYEGAPYGTITIPVGAEVAADLNAANPGLNSVFIGRQDDICTDAMPTFTFTNETCAAVNINVFVLVEESGLDVDNDSFIDFRTDCPAVEHVVSVEPAQLTTLVTDDGSSCGTPTIELRSANATVCSTLTGPACSVNGDSYNWDFSADPVVTVLDDANCSNAPATISGTVNCSGCAPCDADAGIWD